MNTDKLQEAVEYCKSINRFKDDAYFNMVLEVCETLLTLKTSHVLGEKKKYPKGGQKELYSRITGYNAHRDQTALNLTAFVEGLEGKIHNECAKHGWWSGEVSKAITALLKKELGLKGE